VTGEPSARALRLAEWIDRRRIVILVVSALIAAAGALLAVGLPVHTDLSYLLPPSADSVKQLRALEKRATVFGTVMIGIESDDPKAREAAAVALRDRLKKIDPKLVAGITYDDGPARSFVWDHRFMFASLEDLTSARDALDDKIRKAKLKANPLYVDFEDDDSGDAKDKKPDEKKDEKKEEGKPPADEPPKEDKAQALRKRLDEAEQKKDTPSPLVSKDKRLQLIIVRSAFESGAVSEGTTLVHAIKGAIHETQAEHRDVEIGITGDVPIAIAEHASILQGMLLATFITVGLVALGLLGFYSSVRAVGALFWSLAVGAIATFGFARLTIGYLNLATAFLSSIVVGNGINCGIVLLARHLEERRRGRRGVPAIAAAMEGTWTGTLAASLTAATAYGALVVTSFRGFRHFGVIGGVGMVLCWISAYTVLPAALAVLERRRFPVTAREPRLGPILAGMLPRRLQVVALGSLLTMAIVGYYAVGYLRNPPYEDDFKKLRSHTSGLRENRRWSDKIDDAFGTGISGGFALAVDHREDTAPLVKTLRDVDEGKSDDDKLLRRVSSLDDLMPTDQTAKLKVLADIRKLLDDDALNDLEDDDKKEALRLRPPDHPEVADADVPAELAWPFTEKDGSRGKIVLAYSGVSYDLSIGPQLYRFTVAFRQIKLVPGTVVGCTGLVMTDLLRSLEVDGPRATIAAILGALLVVLLLVGVSRHALITIFCGTFGTLLLLAIVSALDVKVNFLDFVALPITIGIGIDYSVNVVARDRKEASHDARRAMATTGAAVFICSFTTIVGYGSLLLSDNGGIRTFGLTAILGEVTCLTTALAVAPALLDAMRRRDIPTAKADPPAQSASG
jgi:predicted RND superfamily exporter protein